MADLDYQERPHPGQEQFGVLMDTADGKRRSAEQMKQFVAELHDLAERHDFKLKTWGTGSGLKRFFGRIVLTQLVDDALDYIATEDEK